MKVRELFEEDPIAGAEIKKIPVKRRKVKRFPIKPKDAPIDKKED